MYLDIKGLVTIGVGNLIDPQTVALGLPFVHKADGTTATSGEIAAEWSAIKANSALAQKGYKACEPLTQLCLTDQAIDDLVRARLNQNEAILKQSFSDWDSWPADAQTGVLSMAWAMGAGFPSTWPRFAAACRAKDWAAAAANCHIETTGNPGVAPRNDADVALFTNAATVAANGLDPSVLLYGQPVPPASSGATDAGTSASDAG
jgi:GH24 family phage-related lysozyme (muramidase)